MTNSENQIKVYQAPEGAVLTKDYFVRIRPLGEETWTPVPTYQVKVDMHDVRRASMAYFDFQGSVEVEVEKPGFYEIYRVDLRPLSLGITVTCEKKKVRFILHEAANLSVEINKDRFHNLHLFAGRIEDAPGKENRMTISAGANGIGFVGDNLSGELSRMPENRTLRLTPGIYYVGEGIWHLPSHTNLYLEGGVILIGALSLEHVEDVHIFGRGMLYLADFHRFGGICGVKISHSQDISIENLIILNPPHYSVYLGASQIITLRGIKAFSCEGWSDGIDMMSCEEVNIENCFLRTSDDCIAIYGSRWDNYGDTRNVTVKDCALWADVAHPMHLGTHGDHGGQGDVIGHILFENIDVLEHHEFQKECLGVMAINAGDHNRVQDVTFRNIRIEPFEHGEVFHFAVKKDPAYNPVPGREVRNILAENIYVTTGDGEEVSAIRGYDEQRKVSGVTFRNIIRDGKKAKNLAEAGICVGEYADGIVIE